MTLRIALILLSSWILILIPCHSETEKFQKTKELANQGNAEAEFDLGVMYDYGREVEKNEVEAVRWYRKAAEQGYPKAQSNLGFCYDTGRGVGQDTEEAIKWYRKAAKQKDVWGEHNLGCAYATGDGVAQDPVEAAKWFLEAAEQGLAVSQKNIANRYYKGNGVQKSMAKAFQWYFKAAGQSELSYAQFMLGYMYAHGEGIKKDGKAAMNWFRKAADHNNSDAIVAQSNIGWLYEQGLGVPQNLSQAVYWYRKAAEHGFPLAQDNLAQLFLGGRGLEKSNTEALHWFSRAAFQGYQTAQVNLASMYFKGLGVPMNYVEAYKWSNLAAAGDRDAGVALQAARNRDFVSHLMTPEQIAEGQRLSAQFTPKREKVEGIDEIQADHPLLVGQTEKELKATGSGFAISDDGFLLTNCHVVADASSIEIKVGTNTLSAKLIKVDESHDLALLKVETKFLALAVAPSRDIRLGMSVFTIGFPDILLQGLEPKLTKGEISSLAGPRDDPRYFQISVPIQPGSSGGPLVDMQGNVVGITSAQLDAGKTIKITGSLPQNVNYAVKSSFALAFLETVPEIASKLKELHTGPEHKFEDIVQEAQQAAVMVLIY